MGVKTIKSFFAALFVTIVLCVSCGADERTVNLVITKDVIEADLAGFNVYVSNESGTAYGVIDTPGSDFTTPYIPGETEFPVEVTLQVPVGVDITFYFVATALDFTLNESEYSEEASRSFYIPPPTTTIPTTTTTVDDEPPSAPSLEIVRLIINIVLDGV